MLSCMLYGSGWHNRGYVVLFVRYWTSSWVPYIFAKTCMHRLWLREKAICSYFQDSYITNTSILFCTNAYFLFSAIFWLYTAHTCIHVNTQVRLFDGYKCNYIVLSWITYIYYLPSTVHTSVFKIPVSFLVKFSGDRGCSSKTFLVLCVRKKSLS